MLKLSDFDYSLTHVSVERDIVLHGCSGLFFHSVFFFVFFPFLFSNPLQSGAMRNRRGLDQVQRGGTLLCLDHSDFQSVAVNWFKLVCAQ